MEEIMTPEQLKEYIRDMPEDEVIRIRFEEADDNGGDQDISGERNV